MLNERVTKLLSIEYENRLMIHDLESLDKTLEYNKILRDNGYRIIVYKDIEAFRNLYEKEIRNTESKIAVIHFKQIYIPYDIRKSFYEVNFSINTLFPRLNASVVKKYLDDLELIGYVYDSLFEDMETEKLTEQFITQTVFSKFNIDSYVKKKNNLILNKAQNATSYLDWINIAKDHSKLSVYSAQVGTELSPHSIDKLFQQFIFDGYQNLSGIVSENFPVILPKTMDFISGRKIAIVVADGMSMFDFEILSKYLDDFEYDYYGSFALIPTTTSISRQSLLCGLYPVELNNPFSLSWEERGFYKAASQHGYNKQTALYGHGYDIYIGSFVRLAAIIINEIDDIVHGQKQGRLGMYNDINLLAKSNKFQSLFQNLLDKGFTIYLTADHGNTHCIGQGSLKQTGVETETRSKRMIVLKGFAEISNELKQRTIIYPGYYMDKNYQYLICKENTSFDDKGEDVMTHGGISIEEVIVPFVKIRRKENG